MHPDLPAIGARMPLPITFCGFCAQCLLWLVIDLVRRKRDRIPVCGHWIGSIQRSVLNENTCLASFLGNALKTQEAIEPPSRPIGLVQQGAQSKSPVSYGFATPFNVRRGG